MFDLHMHIEVLTHTPITIGTKPVKEPCTICKLNETSTDFVMINDDGEVEVV